MKTSAVKIYQKMTRKLINFRDRYYFGKITELIPELALYHENVIVQLYRITEEKNIRSLRELYHLIRSDQKELDFLKKNLTLMGSHFFRGSDWDILNEQCLSSFAGREKVSVWCAGCSSGEEVYSVIMSLLDHLPIDALRILATDYNAEKLERCRAGKYGPTHLEEVPEKYRHHLVRVKSSFTFSPEIRDAVTVRQLNLLTDEYPSGFDLIVCRNVIKFFTPETVKEVQKKLVSSLADGGFLFLSVNDEGDNRETIDDPDSLHVRQIGSCIYQKP